MKLGLTRPQAGGAAALRTPEKIQDLYQRYEINFGNPRGLLYFGTQSLNKRRAHALKPLLLRPAPSGWMASRLTHGHGRPKVTETNDHDVGRVSSRWLGVRFRKAIMCGCVGAIRSIDLCANYASPPPPPPSFLNMYSVPSTTACGIRTRCRSISGACLGVWVAT